MKRPHRSSVENALRARYGGHLRDPKNDRFYRLLPRACEPSVYVAEWSNGWMKVGMTRSPRGRMMGMASEARRAAGAEIVRWHVFYGSGGWATEGACLAAMERVFGAPVVRQELFLCEDFEAALFVVGCAIALLPAEMAPAGAAFFTKKAVREIRTWLPKGIAA